MKKVEESKIKQVGVIIQMYTIKQGDTVSLVAYKHRIRPIDLLIANPFIRFEQDYLPPGKIVQLPSNASIESEIPAADDLFCEFSLQQLEDDRIKIEEFGVKASVIGFSVMAQPIYAWVIGTGEKKCFYSGGWHANEWHTSKFLSRFLLNCVKKLHSDERWHGFSLAELFTKVQLHIVPMVNPDGIDLVLQGAYEGHPYKQQLIKTNQGLTRFNHWSANIRGVDLNHQWPAGWKEEAEGSPNQPWPRHFGGPYPLSEPEAMAIYQYVKKEQPEYVLAFHSQGQVIYWGYRGLESKASAEMVKKLCQASSYSAIQTADSDAGFKDWFIKETRKSGFTIEVGTGTNPLPPQSFTEIWTNNVSLALTGLSL
ncbi:g-D-glutamyl-meso-diaminopimelate peptidase [Alkalicoccobacillus murimartini]|uniref:G-D-glutamyl-meso-diaminopimelate peptidase n=2 Tax=Alkalicoccobacillus murimartini TaxID=171685 RepID=A0ABT9YE18_9BACI|nr:g-D-glutamyl-meso-diaminopimelate peptidase [Alkalicoccobacillus murimartini]